VRGCIQRRIGQLAVRDEQNVGAAVHHLRREAISMHSGMPSATEPLAGGGVVQ
jgi:hypothetical protein